MLSYQQQSGSSLSELMVAMALGLLVMLAATSLFASTLGASKLSLKMTLLRNELATVAHLLSDDIRRAGFNGKATAALGQGNCTNHETQCPFSFQAVRDLDEHCLIIRTDADNDGHFDQTDTAEVRGYVFSNNTLYFIKYFYGTPSCHGRYLRESLTWKTDAKLTDVRFTLLTDSRGGHSVAIKVSGHSQSEPGVMMALNQQVRLRNDAR